MKNTIIALSILFVFLGCNGDKPSPNIQNHNKEVEPQEEYEEIVSYKDIIMQINDINTNKKTNKRVKEIIKEYRYNTSDDDSKNSARKKALTQVKILILEEIGVFVESYLELSEMVENKKYQTYFKQEIKNLTAGIIKTKIIDEKYDGKVYYVKASVLVDPDSVSEGISEILKIKANKSEITKLTKLLQTKENEIDMRSSETISLQKKITNQELLSSAKQEELRFIQAKLQNAQLQLKKYQRDEISLNTELGKIQSKVKKAMQRINNQSKKACMMRKGMTLSEVMNSLGDPSGSDTYCNQEISTSCSKMYVYGGVKLYFDGNTKILFSARGCR